MKKNINFFAVTYLMVLFLTTIISCGDDCGPFPNKFSIKTFDWNLANVEFTDTYYMSSEITNNEVNYANYGIVVVAETEEYFSKTFDVNLLSKAYANDCDIVPPTTDDKIINIEIVVNQDFNDLFLAESNMVEKFKIGYVDNEGYFETMSLVDYIQINPKVSREFVLLLNDAPIESGSFTFTVKITMDGKTLDYDEFTTNFIRITNN